MSLDKFPNFRNYFMKIKERSRDNYIENMDLQERSNLILEIREAIIMKVKESINFDTSKYHIVFIIGGTGAGRSTALCYLRGDSMSYDIEKRYFSLEDTKGIISSIFTPSCTFLPNIEIINDIILVDFPGFNDTRGKLIVIGMELALRILIKYYNPKILLLESINNIERYFTSIYDMDYNIKRLFNNPEDCLLGLTKYSENYHFIKIKLFQKEIDNLQKYFVEGDDLEVLRKNQDLLKEKICNQRKLLLEQEESILSKIAPRKMVRFDILEDSSKINEILESLRKLPNITLNNNFILSNDFRWVTSEIPSEFYQNLEALP